MRTYLADRFRYCLNTSTLRGYELPLEETIRVAAKAGYGAIEPWIREIDRYVETGGSLPDLRRLIEDQGLTVEGAIGFFPWIVDDRAEREAALGEARRNMETLRAIGGKIRMPRPSVSPP